MSLFPKEYCIKDWNGKNHHLNECDLYNRIIVDSKSDYDWFTSATELVRVCNEPSFSKGYAIAIKIVILNCFARLEFKKGVPSHEEPTDKMAVYSCYNSLSSMEQTLYPEEKAEVTKAKSSYLHAIIKSISASHFDLLSQHHHVGPTYTKMCEDWVTQKFNENISKEEIDFEQLIRELHIDFEQMVTSAEGNGSFKKDDEEYQKEQKKFWSSLNLNDV